jgi:hypothetical protein
MEEHFKQVWFQEINKNPWLGSQMEHPVAVTLPVEGKFEQFLHVPSK